MGHVQISTETSAWLLQAKDFLNEARRLKPGPERNELRQTAKVLREIAKLEAVSSPTWELARRPEHDPEKCEAVFRKDHAQTTS